MGTGLTVTSWCCASVTGSRAAKTISPLSEAFWQRSSGGRRRRDAVGVRGEADKHHKALWWWSECECRSHTFNKRLVLSLTNSYTPHTRETDPTTSMQIHKHMSTNTHTLWYTAKTDCILNPAEPPTFTNKNGQLKEQRLLLLNAVCTIQPPQLSLTGAFYIQSSMLIWNIKD